MKRLLWLLPWLLLAAPASAQQWLPGGLGIPIVCAYNASPATVTTGQFVYAQCSNTGVLAGGGGGGGGAVTLAAGSVSAGAYTSGSFVAGALADGAITTLGTEADTAWSTGNGTAIAILKKIAGNTAAFSGAVTISGPLGAAALSAGVSVTPAGTNATAYTLPTGATGLPGIESGISLQITNGTDSANNAKTATAVNVTPINCSGTASATAANASNLGTATIHGFTIKNEHATNDVGFNLTTTAVLGSAGTYRLCGYNSTNTNCPSSYSTPAGLGSNTAVSVIASGASTPYTCTAW